MKRKIICMLMTLSLIVSFTSHVYAGDENSQSDHQPQNSVIIDRNVDDADYGHCDQGNQYSTVSDSLTNEEVNTVTVTDDIEKVDVDLLKEWIADDTELAIHALLEARLEIINQAPVSLVELNRIDLELALLGVEFLTISQVVEQFPDTKANRELALIGETDVLRSKVSTPPSTVNQWMSYRTSNYLYNGQRYNIQRLVAQPMNTRSPLWNEGSRIVQFNRNYRAGAVDVINSIGWTAVGQITGSSLIIGLFDAIRSFVSGISMTTEVNVSHIVYSWSSRTTAVFTYVRLESQTDDHQWLSLISTRTQTEVGYQMPSSTTYRNTSGNWVLFPQIVHGNRSITITPSGYDSIAEAVQIYATGGSLRHNAVSRIVISGPEGQSVQTINPVYPQFPLHCE